MSGVDTHVVDDTMIEGLRSAVKGCSERGLHFAAKWAAELLASTPAHKRREHISRAPFLSSTPARPPTLSTPSTMGPPPIPAPSLATATPIMGNDFAMPPWDIDLAADTDEEDKLAEGMACFQAREFARASHILKTSKAPRGRFLTVYSRYLAGEKRAIQDHNKLDGTRIQPAVPVNKDLVELFETLTEFKMDSDPWMVFLKALLLSRLSRRAEAIEQCILSLKLYLWNWSVWVLMSDLIKDAEELSGIFPLIPVPPTHPLLQLFQIRTLNMMHQPTDNELGLCDRLLGPDFFPNSLWIMSLRACVLYHLHDFGQAEQQFQKILERDPYRIDDIDIYSNILYVTENRLQLSKLAHDFLAIDKDRPEVCCLVGNHYSLRAEHEKAIKYFKRATDLDRTYLSAWTLMGHEYVEMKNSHAAIEAYRRAVDCNRKDYRAWYGLGQAYELLNMHQYALYYYQHATALRPYDVRLWQAQGASYEEMGRPQEAMECFKRALLGADANEISIDLKIAKLHDDMGQFSEAASYHTRIIDLSAASLKPVAEYARSCIYIAKHHLYRGGGDLEAARNLAESVAKSNSEHADAATDLFKKIQAEIIKNQQLALHGQQQGQSLQRLDTRDAATLHLVQ